MQKFIHLGEIDVVGILDTTRLLDLVHLVFASYPSYVNSDIYDNLSYLMSGQRVCVDGNFWRVPNSAVSPSRFFAFQSAAQQRTHAIVNPPSRLLGFNVT